MKGLPRVVCGILVALGSRPFMASPAAAAWPEDPTVNVPVSVAMNAQGLFRLSQRSWGIRCRNLRAASRCGRTDLVGYRWRGGESAARL
jgi:hypothetical protein